MLEESGQVAEDKQAGGQRQESVDLGSDLSVEIPDAVCEREVVKFKIRTVTSLLPRFSRPEFSVVRSHEEFVWLADRLSENEDYAGLVVPPPPPPPDFAASKEKLDKLSKAEDEISSDAYQQLKAELEAEYLATFKKTVAMHELFLRRVAQHPRLREDETFKIFLEYDDDLNVRHKNKREMVQGLLRTGWKAVDDAYLSGQPEKDPFFKTQKRFMLCYFVQLRLCMVHADKMAKAMKATADSYISIGSCCQEVVQAESSDQIRAVFRVFAEFSDGYRKLEGRAASDSDLKLSDTLFYYVNDCTSVRDLLYRRLRALANFESANKDLEKARAKGKDVQRAEHEQEAAYSRFEGISESARAELADFKHRWLLHLHRSLTEHTELQIGHARSQVQLLSQAIRQVRKV